MWCVGEHLNIFYNKLQKNSLKNFICMQKDFLGKKTCSVSKVIPLDPSYRFWPKGVAH